jgi:hypothetical protein
MSSCNCWNTSRDCRECHKQGNFECTPAPQPEKDHWTKLGKYWQKVGEYYHKQATDPQPEKDENGLVALMLEGLLQPHPATKVIEEGYFCSFCGKQYKNGTEHLCPGFQYFPPTTRPEYGVTGY